MKKLPKKTLNSISLKLLKVYIQSSPLILGGSICGAILGQINNLNMWGFTASLTGCLAIVHIAVLFALIWLRNQLIKKLRETCVASNCNKKVGDNLLFCSLNCACYSYAFSMRTDSPGYDRDGWNHNTCNELARTHGKELRNNIFMHE